MPQVRLVPATPLSLPLSQRATQDDDGDDEDDDGTILTNLELLAQKD